MTPHPNGQPAQATAFKQIAQGAQDGQRNKRTADAIANYHADPSDANRSEIEELLTHYKHKDLRQTQPRQPDAAELDKMSDEEIITLLDSLLNSRTLELDITNSWDFTPPDRDWLIVNWLPAGRIGMLTGEGEKGKSVLAIQLAVGLASGGGQWEDRGAGIATEWTGPGTCLPFPEVRAGKVIMAGWEDEKDEVRRRIGWIEAAERNPDPLHERIGKNFTYIDLARHGNVWARTNPYAPPTLTPTGLKLRQYCEQQEGNAKLLILDPLINAFGEDDNANQHAAHFMADWGGWARQNNCAVLLLHHPSKGDKENEDHGYRGAYAWFAESRFYWQLTDKKDDDGRTQDWLIARKMSYARRPPAILLHRDETTKWTWQANNSTGDAADGFIGKLD